MKQSNVGPLVLTQTEAGEQLGVSIATIRQLVASGELPTIRVGKRYRIPVEGLRHWVRKQPRSGSKEGRGDSGHGVR